MGDPENPELVIKVQRVFEIRLKWLHARLVDHRRHRRQQEQQHLVDWRTFKVHEHCGPNQQDTSHDEKEVVVQGAQRVWADALAQVGDVLNVEPALLFL